jgi:hypothetical protein
VPVKDQDPAAGGEGAHTREELEEALAQAVTLVTNADIHGWFKHCGGYKVASV